MRFLRTPVFLIALISGNLAHGEEPWTVSSEQAACLVAHADAYLNFEGDPLVIFLPGCPEPNFTQAMANSSENSGTFNVGAGDPVLVLTKSELRCVVERLTPLPTSEMISIPRRGICE